MAQAGAQGLERATRISQHWSVRAKVGFALLPHIPVEPTFVSSNPRAYRPVYRPAGVAMAGIFNGPARGGTRGALHVVFDLWQGPATV